MLHLLTIAAAAAGAWGLLVVAIVLLAPRPKDADERHPARTEDGWVLTLHRYLPTGPVRHPVPVILGHGLVMNRLCWELSDASSLPRALAARGHDTWVPEFRGCASALPPKRGGDPAHPWDWSIDDYVEQDFPAIVETVKGLTGAEKVSWVGHSMGGMIAYLRAARFGDDDLHRLVTLGSPVRFDHIGGFFGNAEGLAHRGLGRIDAVRVRLLLTMLLPWTLALPPVTMWLSGNHRLLSTWERVRLLQSAFENTSARLARFFLELRIHRHELCDRPHPDGEASGLERLRVPLLVIAGGRDRLAPPGAVRPGYLQAGSERKAFRLFGDRNAADPGPAFGHADLISSHAAMQWVLPVVAGWLEGDEPQISAPTLQQTRRSATPTRP